MDEKTKNLYVFGYGLTLIIPYLIFMHSLELTFSYLNLFFILAGFAGTLWVVTKIAALKPIYNGWIFAIHVAIAINLVQQEQLGIAAVLLALVVGILVVTIWKVQRLESFYKIWMKGAHFIGTVISTLALTILFYFVFGFAGIVLRLINKDLLDRKIEPDRESYWKPLEHQAQEKSDYLRQF